MPQGEVYFRQDATKQWVDVWLRYGISFSDVSLSRLMTPAPNKAAVENKSRLQHGKRVARNAGYVRKDERDVSLEMHLSAPDRATFWRRYQAFCHEFLDNGFFDIKHRDITYVEDDEEKAMVFRMTYVSCDEFSEFQQQLAKFTLSLNEPDPTNRGEEDLWAEETSGQE